VPFGSAFRALFIPDGSMDHRAIREVRLPRTFAGVLVGAAMGLAGALIQAMTRNPLADPGVLGINAGASFMLVVAVVFVGLTSAAAFVWFSFAGALGAMVLVYALGSVGRGGATPERLAVAGIAFGAAVGGSTTVLTFLRPDSFRELTRWTVGSIANPHPTVFTIIMPFVLVGAVIALAVARPLNAVALGDDLARALGADIGRVRLAGVVAVTLLAGGGTSAGGPVAFVGFVVPHVARRICGPDQRWVFAYTIVLSPVVVLVADIVGRTIVRPDELPVGVVTAFVGAPLLIYVVRRRRTVQL
ncbi:MAG: FecCD family ABC transporter permease, partial [Acidimicrobiia bacterium]